MKEKLIRIVNGVIREAFGLENCRVALSAYGENRDFTSISGVRQKTVYILLKVGGKFKVTDRIMKYRYKALSTINGLQVYDKHTLNILTNRIFDMPEVVVDSEALVRVNVLIPAFSIESISAGFFGVFNVALFAASCGFKVRLVLFDNFYYDEDIFRGSLSKFPSFSDLFDRVEVEYIGDRKTPLIVSPFDGTVATVWYSAYFAQKIQRATVNTRPFLYLIQDYESAFYPFSSLNALSDDTYRMCYNGLVSTKPLKDYITAFDSFSKGKFIHFNNACSSILPDLATFKVNKLNKKKRFVFYSRPAVNRNMFELAALSIITAFERGVFGNGSEWDFYGMGLGDVEVKVTENISIIQLPRMSLKEYEEQMYTFDLCLSLMASPHPSIVPFDLSSAGALVVTNTFEVKNEEYFKDISDLILVANPNVDSIVDKLRVAIGQVSDLEGRYERACNVNYPKTWENVWDEHHKEFLYETFKA